MSSRLRRYLEAIVFAGMKPASGARESTGPRWLAAVRDRLEKFISGGRPLDPLYLSNRTWGQKLRLAAVVATPCLILAGIGALFLGGVFQPKPAPPSEPTPAEIIARFLPDLDKTAQIEVNQDAEVTQITVDRQAERVVGALKNKTNRVISVELVIQLTNNYGSHMGSEVYRVENAPPARLVSFSFPLKAPGALYALVTGIRTLK
ncbi:MAG: hypothetical protein ABSC23_18155 [Bryobacteraceae bacterium]|jgi:hypothetical protein